ncbi:nuclease-related domain-containing protein [Roseateles sp.]|uniref:nuclease-related domain-containing protein n=1 Tax=Roseateles sp. TaxID=1971397 RepID=UPI0039343C6A
MLFKSADDKSKRLRLLESLQGSPHIDAGQRNWLAEELTCQQRGLQGERDAAFHLDSLLRDGANTALLHDLRFVVDDEVAQIDHLVFNRLFDFILIETKCYNGHVLINEHGEFSVRYGSGKLFGVPSPLAQSERHGRVLARLLERLGITGRLGTQPRFHHLVLLHPKAIITRPAPERFDTRNVIKADQFPEWRERWVDSASATTAMSSLLNIRGRDTLKDWAELLIQAHHPTDLLALPDFMRPGAPSAPARQAHAEMTDAPPKRLICATCGSKISFAEGKFCWSKPERFGGLQYCREHQGKSDPASTPVRR